MGEEGCPLSACDLTQVLASRPLSLSLSLSLSLPLSLSHPSAAQHFRLLLRVQLRESRAPGRELLLGHGSVGRGERGSLGVATRPFPPPRCLFLSRALLRLFRVVLSVANAHLLGFLGFQVENIQSGGAEREGERGSGQGRAVFFSRPAGGARRRGASASENKDLSPRASQSSQSPNLQARALLFFRTRSTIDFIRLDQLCPPRCFFPRSAVCEQTSDSCQRLPPPLPRAPWRLLAPRPPPSTPRRRPADHPHPPRKPAHGGGNSSSSGGQRADSRSRNMSSVGADATPTPPPHHQRRCRRCCAIALWRRRS